MNTLTIAGAGDVSFKVSGTTFRTADFIGASGTVTADLSGVINAVVVNAGHGTNVIISGSGNDTINLLSGSGADTIVFTAEGNGTDTVSFFQSTDILRLRATGLDVLNGTGGALVTATTAVNFLMVTAGTATMDTDDNVIFISAAFSSAGTMLAAIADAGTREINLLSASAGAAGGNLVVVWTDGSSSYVSLVDVATGAAIIATGASVETLLTLSGVSGGALVTANFSYFLGA